MRLEVAKMVKGNKIGEGSTAEVFSIAHDKVAKVFYEHIQVSQLKGEMNISAKIASLGLNVPAVYGEGDIEGKKAIIYEKIDGFPLTELLEKGLLSAIRSVNTMVSLQIYIHSKEAGDLPPLKFSLENRIKRAESLSGREKERIIDYLQTLPDGKQVCHGDYHPDNILISMHGKFVIDWAVSAAGSPLADLARSLLILQYGGFPEKVTKRMYFAERIKRRMIAQYYIYLYKKHSPFKRESFQQWLLPVAAGRLSEKLPPKEIEELLSFVRRQLNSCD